MKILHIIPSYFPAHRYGGPIGSVHGLNVGLAKSGAEITVYTTNIDGKDDLDVSTEVPVIIDGVKIFYFKSFFPRSWFYSRDMRKALAKNGAQFDIFHITSTFLAASTLGAYYAKKFKKPYIISPRGNLMKNPMKKNKKKWFKKWLYIKFIEKRNLRGADAVHFTTKAEKDDYVRQKFPIKRAIIVPNIVDISKFNIADCIPNYLRNRFKLAADLKIVIFFGRLNWIKGFDTLIPAFAKCLQNKNNIILVLAGPDENNYQKEVELKIKNCKLKIGKDVILAGMLTGDDKIAAYKESDVFVLPSYSENFGMAAVEAMAAELPVVITKGVGISKEVEKSAAGFVVEKDVNQVSEAILKILENPEMAKKMGENGKKLVEQEFSGEKVAERWMEEYNKLL